MQIYRCHHDFPSTSHHFRKPIPRGGNSQPSVLKRSHLQQIAILINLYLCQIVSMYTPSTQHPCPCMMSDQRHTYNPLSLPALQLHYDLLLPFRRSLTAIIEITLCAELCSCTRHLLISQQLPLAWKGCEVVQPGQTHGTILSIALFKVIAHSLSLTLRVFQNCTLLYLIPFASRLG